MRVKDYLDLKYAQVGASSITAAEARTIGMRYPPPKGWLRTFGEIEISKQLADRLIDVLESKTASEGDVNGRNMRGLKALHTVAFEPATKDVTSNEFLRSFAWRKARMQALLRSNSTCECCGRTVREHGVALNVDHIKPRKLFPQFALDQSNLQVLCEDCNHGKGNWDWTDWRKQNAG